MDDSISTILASISHNQPKRLAVDFGAANTTGIHCSVVAELRKHFGLEKQPVKVHEPIQMLGYIDDDLADAMGVDTVHCMPYTNGLGVPNTGDWKEWRTPWGQTVLVAEKLALKNADNGEVLAFPQGDINVPASAVMPSGGYFFDATNRQGEFDEDDPDVNDNTEEFALLADAEIASLKRWSEEARRHNRAVVASLPGTALGDVSSVPAMFMKNPKGIRDVAEWYISIAARPDFIHGIFERQTKVALQNLKNIHDNVGDAAFDVAFVCGTDFGTQISTFCSLDTFIELYQPYYRRINDWIHANTPWKTFKHSCGAIEPFIDALIDSGFDILNPVQCSATGMAPELLKEKYGKRVVFWGGGVDTQQTLPFGTPQEVRQQVLERCRIFSPGGGFVFNSIHNVQALTPTENMVALLDAVKEFNSAGK